MIMEKYFNAVTGNTFVQLVLIWIALDTFLGVLRALKQHNFNSSVGIDGAIRKVAMVGSVAFLMLVDLLVGVNFISWIPGDFVTVIGLQKIGLGEFFCVLFFLYESISILKNLALCGAPIPKSWMNYIEKFLNNMTAEMPGK